MSENSPRSAPMTWRISSFDLARFQRSRAYDILMRLPVLACPGYETRAASDKDRTR